VRMSRLFGHTLREPPADAEAVSHQLLVRGGFVRPLAAGLYTHMPLGLRVIRRLEAIVREEMNRLGGQEMLMPLLVPAALWESAGRWEEPVPMRSQDQAGREYVLAKSHEEVVATVARREVRSYRELPAVVYQIQSRVHDEARPRGGLMRLRESRALGAYSLHADEADRDRFYPNLLEALRRISARCDLPTVQAEARPGIVGGADSHRFTLPHPFGDSRLIRCPACEYAATAERAELQLPSAGPAPPEEARPVATPDCPTIADVAAFVGVPTSQTLKAVFYAWERPGEEAELVFVVIRGDLEVNESKLLHVLGGGSLRAASDEEIRAIGAQPGYASPVGLSVRESRDGQGAMVVGDRSIEVGCNFVAGANREGYHLTGVNYPRDFSVTLTTDVAQAQAGHLCPRCAGALEAQPALELGYCLRLGTRFAQSLGATYPDAEGQEQPLAFCSCGVDLARLMAAVVETHHDAFGIVWPPALAPFDVHLILLGKGAETQEAAEQAYTLLQEAGLEALYDARSESAGVKFTDADLIGCPVRITVSDRSLEAGGVEMKVRREKERTIVPLHGLLEAMAEHLEP
jgi:prolyl-tRNA synthetase